MTDKNKRQATEVTKPGASNPQSDTQFLQWLETNKAAESSPSPHELRQSHSEQLQTHQTEQDRDAALYQIAPVGFITLDDKACIRNINPTALSLFDARHGDLLGQPFAGYLDDVDQPIFLQHFTQLKASKETVAQNLTLKLAKDRLLDVHLEMVLDDGLIDGMPSYLCVMYVLSTHSLAARDKAYQMRKLQMITNTIPAYIAYVDKDQRYQFANKAYESWFTPSMDTVIGKTVREVIGEESYNRVKKYIDQALAGKTVKFEANATHPLGNEVDVAVNYIPDFTSAGTVQGYFAINQNITEIRQRERLDKLHLLESARVARINTMGELVAELAHELNQPLAAITIYSDAINRMLRKSATEMPEMSRALEEIRLQAERAGDVIRHLREFVSKRELLFEELELNQIVQEVLHLISVEARWHDARVNLELGSDLALVGVDRILIEQVILNLARNAIEAMEAISPDRRVLTIKTRLAFPDMAELEVEDTGPGIEKDALEKIFDPFYTSKAHGMGMGLAISRNIVKAHNGHLWAVPNENGGSTFTFTLPLQQPRRG